MRPRHAALSIALLGLLASQPAADAESDTERFRDEPDALAFSIEGLGAALVPGSLVHGTGLWVRGDREGAGNLLRMEGTGLAIAAASGLVLATTGASRRLANITIPFLVSGTGLFLQSWLADIYGSAGGGRRGAVASLGRAPLSLELSALAVHDPQFRYNAFGRVAATSWLGAWRIAPAFAVAFDADNQRGQLELTRRVWGPGSKRASGDGSHLEVSGELRGHRYGDEGFQTGSGELRVGGRLDFRRVGVSLAGSFSELAIGFGLEATRYDENPGTADFSDMLLVRFAYGLYLGRPRDRVRGEVSLYYDHRRDEIAGGVSPGQQASGFLGYFGAELDLDIGDRTGVVGSFQIGSAAVGAVGVRYHLGRGARP